MALLAPSLRNSSSGSNPESSAMEGVRLVEESVLKTPGPKASQVRFLCPPPLCPNCGSENLAKIKGCIRCLDCHFKEDCYGW
jgi:predicted Zn-ribbon and HTH transcriptional regulator